LSKHSTDIPAPPPRPSEATAAAAGVPPAAAEDRPPLLAAATPAALPSAEGGQRRQRFAAIALLSRSLPLGFLLTFTACSNNVPLPKTMPAAAAHTAAEPAIVPGAQRAFDQAVALLKQQQYAQAADTLAPVAAKHPELPGLLVNLAVAYIHLERQEHATAALQQALTTDPEHPAALNWLAILERRAGRFEEAKSLYQRLLAAHPESRHGHLNLGILCDLYLRQADCALEHYRRYQELAAGEDAEVGSWIADLERRRQRG
jgi:Flp pilus assembly protein TadD